MVAIDAQKIYWCKQGVEAVQGILPLYNGFRPGSNTELLVWCSTAETGAFTSTPNAALELLLVLLTIDIFIKLR